MIRKFRVFLKFQFARKSHLLLTLSVILLFSSTLFFLPINNPVEYSLDYQRDDAIGLINTTLISDSVIQDRMQAIENNGNINNISHHYITHGFVSYDELVRTRQMQLRVEFHTHNSSILKIKPLWFEDSNTTSLITRDTSTINVSTEVLSAGKLSQNFDGVLSLPLQFKSNFSTYFYGIDISADEFSGFNLDEQSAKFKSYLNALEEQQYALFKTNLLEFDKPVIQTLSAIETGYPTIILQNFILIISVMAGLIVFLYFLIQSGFSKDLKQYEILYHRGYEEEDIKYRIPVFLIIWYSLLTLVISSGLFFFTSQRVITIQHSLPAILVGLIAAGASLSVIREFEELQPQDATDIHINPSVAEYIFLALSVISLLVNIYLNIPAFRYLSLFLVLAIYTSISTGIGGLIYKSLQTIRKKTINYLESADSLNQTQSELWMVNLINLKNYRKYLKLTILFGIIFMIVVAHVNLSNQVTQQLEEDENTTLLWGSYPAYQDISELRNRDLSFTGMIPATYLKLGVRLSGVIITSPLIFSQFNSLEKTHEETPAFYLNNRHETFGDSIFDLEGISASIEFGNLSQNIDIQPTTNFDQSIKILGQFDFLFFTNSDAYQGYNQSVQLLVTTKNNTTSILETRNIVEADLPQRVSWMEVPPDSPLIYSLKQDISNQINFQIMVSVALVMLFILGFVEPQIILRDEFEMINQRGYVTSRSLGGALISSVISSLVLLLFSILGTAIILFLVDFFRVLPQISISFDITTMLTVSVVASSGWLVGTMLGYRNLVSGNEE